MSPVQRKLLLPALVVIGFDLFMLGGFTFLDKPGSKTWNLALGLMIAINTAFVLFSSYVHLKTVEDRHRAVLDQKLAELER